MADEDPQHPNDLMDSHEVFLRLWTHHEPEAGFRESYRIEGETIITVNDYTSGRIFEDAISNAFYPVDLHTKNGVKPKPL
ncbi:MAG: FAD-dependent oxidoreductase, partial [Akkermansiaceae bacterium]|nr:FAD-dependent oxidoreductase [Akkermansiaceae bacterium]